MRRWRRVGGCGGAAMGWNAAGGERAGYSARRLLTGLAMAARIDW